MMVHAAVNADVVSCQLLYMSHHDTKAGCDQAVCVNGSFNVNKLDRNCRLVVGY